MKQITNNLSEEDKHIKQKELFQSILFMNREMITFLLSKFDEKEIQPILSSYFETNKKLHSLYPEIEQPIGNNDEGSKVKESKSKIDKIFEEWLK